MRDPSGDAPLQAWAVMDESGMSSVDILFSSEPLSRLNWKG
jgi:hypothetical protein